MTKLEWLFESIGGWGGSTGQAWKNILLGSGLNDEALLGREALQNSSDAQDKSLTGAPVRVRITRRILKGAELTKLSEFLLVKEGLQARIDKLGLAPNNALSKLLAPQGEELELTIVEDFNTI